MLLDEQGEEEGHKPCHRRRDKQSPGPKAIVDSEADAGGHRKDHGVCRAKKAHGVYQHIFGGDVGHNDVGHRKKYPLGKALEYPQRKKHLQVFCKAEQQGIYCV